jgi:tRNA dimethylallyltransferase
MKKICLFGPTASGKTKIAMELYDELSVHLISVDSAQIYNDCNIGSAKPSDELLKKYPHEMINLISPIDNFSVSLFIEYYNAIIERIEHSNRNPLLVGGTMMYFNSIFNPLNKLPGSDLGVRAEVEGLYQKHGIEWLYQKVKSVDPETTINEFDQQRLKRSLEVFLMTGKPLTSFYSKESNKPKTSGDYLKIAIVPEDRGKLHEAIARRTKEMLNDGIVEEVRALFKKYPSLTLQSNSMRSVGYRQVGMMIKKEIPEDELFNKILFATRQLAKRQITWIRGMDNTYIFDPFKHNVTNKIKHLIQSFINKNDSN